MLQLVNCDGMLKSMKKPIYLTVHQVAKKLGISRQAVDKRIRTRKIKCEIYGRTRLIEKLVAEKLLMGLAVFLLVATSAFAEPNWNALADAIYLAEGGAKAAHPYGIMQKYKHTSPRQACLNTIRHKWADFRALQPQGDEDAYLAYLASRYAPIGAKNDPQGLNKNWLRNVEFFYRRAR